MNSVIINEGQLLPQDDEWVARHLVRYFNAPLSSNEDLFGPFSVFVGGH